MTDNTHYITGTPGGALATNTRFLSQVTMNPQYFKTLYRKYWHFKTNSTDPFSAPTLGAGSAEPGMSPSVAKELIFNKTFTIRSKYTLTNPAGDAKALPCSLKTF